MTSESDERGGVETVTTVAADEEGRRAFGAFIRRVAIDVTPLQRSRAFRFNFVGQAVSLIGTQVTQVAVPLQVFGITHSSLDVGLVGVVAVVPLVFFGLYGGAIADAVDRRKILIVTATGAGLVSTVLMVQALLGLEQLWLLYACVAVQAAFGSVSAPTRRAILPQLVEPTELPAANTILMGIFSVGVVLGPLVAGVVIGVSGGYAAAYAVDIATFMVAALTTVVGLPALPPARNAARAGLHSVVEGLRFLRGRTNLLMTFVHDINAMVFGMPRAVFPALAVTHFHGTAGTAGLLYAAPGVGVMIAAASGGWTSRVHRQGLAVVAAIAVWGASITLFGLTSILWVALALLALGGAADTISAVFRSTMTQAAAPHEMQGRLAGVYMVVVTGGPRLGDLETGVVANLTSPTFAVVSGGLACLGILGALSAAVPSFLRYDARDPTP